MFSKAAWVSALLFLGQSQASLQPIVMKVRTTMDDDTGYLLADLRNEPQTAAGREEEKN